MPPTDDNGRGGPTDAWQYFAWIAGGIAVLLTAGMIGILCAANSWISETGFPFRRTPSAQVQATAGETEKVRATGTIRDQQFRQRAGLTAPIVSGPVKDVIKDLKIHPSVRER